MKKFLTILSIVFAIGCVQTSSDQTQPASSPALDEEEGPRVSQAGPIDFSDLPWDIDPAQVVYSDGLLPPQELFDWYAESGYYQSADGQPSAMLTADTLIWADQGSLAADGVEWTLFVTAEGSPVSLDPAQYVDHCIVRQVVEGETLADPYETVFLGEVDVMGSTVSWNWIDMVEAHTQDVVYFTTTLQCTMRPNTSGETVLISAVFTGVINPRLAQTGQEIEVEFQEHDSLVFYHLPTPAE